MRPGPRNLLTDVPGLTVGQSTDTRLKSGVSVVVGDRPMVTGVHVMGGAPGTRETDLLRPDASVGAVDALVLAGGSAFGLDAASGVVAGLAADGRGFDAAGHLIPIVPAAILFDLANGGDKVWDDNPYRALGRAAYDVRGVDLALGSYGAGTGATVAGLKGGIGSASAVTASGITVGALVAVNAVGQVTMGEGPHFWAAPFEIGDEFGGLGTARDPVIEAKTKFSPGTHTTIAVVACDAILSKAEVTRVAIAAHDGIARAVVPAHTPMDGDLVFAAATGQREAGADDMLMLGHVAAICLSRAIARAVWNARAAAGDLVPTWQEKYGKF